METLGEILDEKGHTVFTVSPSASVFDAVRAMAGHRVGALLVCDADEPVGIVTERDVMLRVILERRDVDRTSVGDVMTRDVMCAEPTTSAEQAMALMTEHRCRHLPIVEGGRVNGIVSIGDLVRVASRDQELQIRSLMEYVSTGFFPGIVPSARAL